MVVKRMEKREVPVNTVSEEQIEQKEEKPKLKNARPVTELLPIKEIKHGVIYTDEGLTAVIGVDSIHYHLLAEEEKRGVDGALATLAASLSFPIQPISITRPVDLKEYIMDLKKLIDQKDGVIREYGYNHLSYLENLTRKEIMIKQDYLVFSCPWKEDEKSTKEELDRRAGLIISGLRRAGHYARVLDTPAVAELFFDIFHGNKPVTVRVQDAFTEDYFSLYVSGKEEPEKKMTVFNVPSNAEKTVNRDSAHQLGPVFQKNIGSIKEKEEIITFS